VYDVLGFGAENGTWRNFYLQGAYELRHGIESAVLDSAGSPDMVGALSVGQLFDSLAIRVNGPRAWDEHVTIDWTLTDLGHIYRTELTNGVLIQDVDPRSGSADLTLTLTKSQLLGLLGGAALDGITTTGDVSVLHTVLGVLDPSRPGFAIVTP
jgi:alkyl sulfatase BDS1-like metallo-beta-lactamase superfamily hydrolase